MSESEIQRRLAVVEEIRRLSYEMRAPHPLALGAVLAEYERRHCRITTPRGRITLEEERVPSATGNGGASDPS